MEVPAERLLTALLSVTEKAATLVRLVRSDKELFDLLIEEKGDETKNKKFQVDFKTLADVLIQEMVRYDIGCQFPRIHDYIYGEESNKFTTVDGNTITLKIGPTQQDTASLIAHVLSGQDKSPELLANVVHRDIKYELSQEMREKMKNVLVDESRLGIWIDPIDGTNEYVQGRVSVHDNGMHPYGLHCVTVLVGVFDRVSGEPLLGVINQPFCHLGDDKLWYGRCIWGLALGDCRLFDIPSLPYARDSNSIQVCVIGQKEQKSIINKLTSSGWRVCQINGCGYKLLCVVDKLADAYIQSQSSSFKWDTCGPQAILKALGGNVIPFETKDEKRRELIYHQPDEPVKPGGEYWRNEGGIIGYIKPIICQSLCDVLQC